MSITAAQKAAAKAVQHRAAQDTSPQIRLLAGPGTGKSFSIGERITWLLGSGVTPASIWAISFTNAATDDLLRGINKYCVGVPNVDKIHVSTLHSLAFSLLTRGGKLTYYPVPPSVLDGWEERYIFDEELAISLGCDIRRCGDLRTHFEAKWSTGAPPLPFISTPKAPITPADEARFVAFYRRTTQTYSCLLPGESVRKCVDDIRAGTLDPVALMKMTHLIVDEYQDLNPADVELVDRLVANGVIVLICGDDDQSIYAFRYAYPIGIQDFHLRHTSAASHTLPTCFRCGSDILGASSNLIAGFPSTGRLPKSLASAYLSSTPPVSGQCLGWKFSSAAQEAKAVATSVLDLIKAGIPAEEILVLLASRSYLIDPLVPALSAAGVPLDVQEDVGWADADGARFVYSLLRLLGGRNDYLALRTVLGLRRGVGVGTCVEIAGVCASRTLNFAAQFTPARSRALFDARQNKALDAAEAAINSIAGWTEDDLLGARRVALDALIASSMPPAVAAEWTTWANTLPVDMTLGELRSAMGARTQLATRERMTEVYQRLGLPVPAGLNPIGRVRVMTLHSCKGLSAQAVFMPGLEEEILPGPRRTPYPAQVEEASRLLYVGITRARALCVLSYANRRMMNGSTRLHNASRFLSVLGPRFNTVPGLTPAEIARTVSDVGNL